MEKKKAKKISIARKDGLEKESKGNGIARTCGIGERRERRVRQRKDRI